MARQQLIVEKYISLSVHPDPSVQDGYLIYTFGMQRFGKPDLVMSVPSRIYVSGACNIINDVARYVAKHKKPIKNGQRLNLNKWTTLVLRVDESTPGKISVEGCPEIQGELFAEQTTQIEE